MGKYMTFAVLYLLSARKFRFWIMPNLTKDVGFMASFWPLYAYTYTGEVIEDEAGEEISEHVKRDENKTHEEVTVMKVESLDLNLLKRTKMNKLFQYIYLITYLN